jgi:acetyltransferase
MRRTMRHPLRPLLQPASIALVGASEVDGSLGRIVYENLLAGGYAGNIYAVNPAHREILGRKAWPTLASIGANIDLAVIATPRDTVASVLESAGAANVKVAIVITAAEDVDSEASRAWSAELAQAAMRGKVRVVGPGALGVVRTPARLEATYCAPRALPGRLALIAQSGAVATAMLDFAKPMRIGFSTVISVGGAVDVGFGELLDLLLADPETDGIVMHVEDIREARAFVSALRAAARTKPVVVLKAGRSLEPREIVSHDDVFDAALRRSGTVRAATYMQLFAAARILARGRIPQGNRVAIVSNGRGPGVMAADSACDRRLELATFDDATVEKLAALLHHRPLHPNPIDVHGHTAPSTLADAAAIALEDRSVDAVIALHVPRPGTPAVDAAHALAGVALRHRKPVLAAWLGAVDRPDVHEALDAGGIANFYTPETSVDALSFLAQYRNNQALLLEAPPPQPEPQAIDTVDLEALRTALADEGRDALRPDERVQILRAFGLPSQRGVGSDTRDVDAITVGIATDAHFGPVIFVRPAKAHSLVQRQALMLPPLNARLAADLLDEASHDAPIDPRRTDALIDVVIGLSALACTLPWVVAVRLDLALADEMRIFVDDVAMAIEPQRRLMRGYPHVAIHPYPVELIGDVTLRDGSVLHVRPIRPEDAALERAFVDHLSDATRYFRFFHRISELTPAMLARFTQVDYDRELALVALAGSGTDRAAFVGVARYIANVDATSAEFAVVVTDAWQRRGVASVLMRGLIVCAKRRGFERLSGMVLRDNESMLDFVRSLGFSVTDDPEDPGQVCATLQLANA